MKSLIPTSLLLAFASFTSAYVHPLANEELASVFSTEETHPLEALRLIQLSPVESRWVTEEEKLDLKRKRIRYMDITDHQHLGFENAVRVAKKTLAPKPDELPTKPAFQQTVKPLLKELSKGNMRTNLETFTNFYTRYYKSDYGRQSSDWLLKRINETAGYLMPEHITMEPFAHSWPQHSNIARIPGKSEKTVVIGAHQDSINMFLPSLMSAPGADDDGSGTVTILEAFRVLVEYLHKSGEQLENTVEFHWYSAEEGGLLGSQAIFSQYEKEGRDVVAMLQQDMTGFTKKTLDAGQPESVGVITDYVDPELTEFIKAVITEYCDIPYVLTECGYACSDHASASKAGYRSAFVIESSFEMSDDHIHTSDDKIDYLNFDHMLQHAKLTLALVYELGNHKFGNTRLTDAMPTMPLMPGGGEL